MKNDRKLLLAVLLLIGLVVWLLVLSINRSQESSRVERLIQTINDLQSKQDIPSKPVDGKTPILGVDYFNGQKGDTGPMGVQGNTGAKGDTGPQGVPGKVGDKGEKGDPAPELQLDCQDGHIAKKYDLDMFWQLTPIKCEVDDE